MIYRVWYVKYECVEVETDDKIEAIDLANNIMYGRDGGDEYELDDIEEIDE